MKKVLLIGGCGYIGGHLIKKLASAGLETFVLDKNDKPVREDPNVIRGDRNNINDLKELKKYGFTYIIDLIAYFPFQTQLLVEQFGSTIENMVHLSTFSVYQVPLASPFSESSPTVADNSSSYMNLKAECERILCDAYHESRFPSVIIRSAPIMGPDDPVSRENYFIKRLLTNTPIIIPDSGKSAVIAVCIRDLTDVIITAMMNGNAIGKIFHVCQKETVSVKTHIENIGKLCGMTPFFLPVSSHDLASAGFNLCAFPYYSTDLLVPSLENAARILDFTPTPYHEALSGTVRWYLDHRPAELPAWPGNSSTQARLASINERLQYINETVFIGYYKRQKQLLNENMPVIGRTQIRKLKEKVKQFFIGGSCTHDEDAIHIILPDNGLEHFENSVFFDSLKHKEKYIFVSSNDISEWLFSEQISTLPENSPETEIDERGKPWFHRFKPAGNTHYTYLQAVPSHKKDIAGYYLFYYSGANNRKDSALYSLDPHYVKLNFIPAASGSSPENNGVPEVNFYNGVVLFNAHAVAEDGRRNEWKIAFNPYRTAYCLGSCRFINKYCIARNASHCFIDSKGNIRVCIGAKPLCTIDNTGEQLNQRIAEIVRETETRRNCRACHRYAICPRCLYPVDEKRYCDSIKTDPYRYRYLILSDLLARLSDFDPFMEKHSPVAVSISTATRRFCMTGATKQARSSLQTLPGRYELKKGIIPFIYKNDYYAYLTIDNVIVKIEAAAFFLLEFLEDGGEFPELSTDGMAGETAAVEEFDTEAALATLEKSGIITIKNTYSGTNHV
ncbi:MAG: NAD-dependent epimerase/dehydratase family protein [Spirochaetales bacterium]|nr:NAD-dependent epimerase/dehydratase family protein [Spirochaetales bacterium]